VSLPSGETDSKPAAETIDCSSGCSLDSSNIVCGVDGVTYQGACLAICQGVAVAQEGPCDGFNTASFEKAIFGVASVATKDEIERCVCSGIARWLDR